MADPRTIQIDGVGKVQVDDSFFNLSPEQQDAQIHEIAATIGHPAAAASPSKGPVELDPHSVWSSLVNQESSNTAGAVGPETPYGRALGLAQTLASTAHQMANKLGMPWRPDLMTATTPEGRKYQAAVGKAYFNEGLDKYHGDVRKALMYYHGGPDERQWGPKTNAYADAILGNAVRGRPLDPPGESQSTPDVEPTEASLNIPSDAPPPQDNVPGFTDAQKAAIMAFLPKAKSGADIQQFVGKLTGHSNTNIGNADQIFEYLRKGGDPSKLAWAKPEAVYSEPPPNPDLDAGHVGAVLARGAGKGLADVLGTGVDAAVMGLVPILRGQGLDPSSVVSKAYDAVTGDFGKAKTALDKYLSAGAEGITGALAGAPGLEASIPNLLKAGLGAGVGGQAASDLFPDSDIAPLIGSILGGGLAHPEVRSAVTEHVPLARSRFVKNVAKNPLGAHMAEVAQDYADLAKRVDPKGAAPRGRQPLTVEQINAVGNRGFAGLEQMIGKSKDLSPADKMQLKQAIRQRSDIPLERSPNMGPGELALSDLPDTVEGRAVKQAVQRFQAGRMLSPAFGGQNLGILGKAWNKTVEWAPVPVPSPVKDLFKLKGGDINKSRMDAAGKAIKRRKLYERAGQKTGPSGFGPAMQDMFDKYRATTDADEVVKAARAAEAARRQSAAQAVRSDNDRITRKVERNIVKPTEGYRGMIYQQTGVTQPVQDQALLYMVKKGEIEPTDLSRIMADPNSLMRGKSKAGLKIMDRIGQLADQGVIKRDPEWKGPPKAEQLPTGVLQWLDAQGAPIRSMGAYAGGIAKNIVRELEEGRNLDDLLDAEEPPKPAAKSTKKKKKKQQQGA